MKYFIVSDIHSFLDPMLKTLDKKGFEKGNPAHILVLCGDLFDRGPQSVELYEYVKSLGSRFIYIRGNHEDLLWKATKEIAMGNTPQQAHFNNGTISTICQFCKLNELDMYKKRSDSLNAEIYTTMNEVLSWIFSKATNYIEIGDYILVHGWIPCICKDTNIYHSKKKMYLDADWNKIPDGEPNESNEDFIKYNTKWEEAVWLNGMEAWKQGVRIPGKTIICGHWHCSYGWSHIRQQRKEWPGKNRKDWLKSFEPFVDEGIIAIDACTAYSGIVNCIVLEVEE